MRGKARVQNTRFIAQPLRHINRCDLERICDLFERIVGSFNLNSGLIGIIDLNTINEDFGVYLILLCEFSDADVEESA
jgi:hypothetical protein